MDSFASVGSVSEAELGKVMAVNLMAPIRLMGEAVKVMLGQGGKEVEGEVKGKEGGGGKGGVIVNVASRAASTGATAGVGYTGSKAGLVSFTFSLNPVAWGCFRREEGGGGEGWWWIGLAFAWRLREKVGILAGKGRRRSLDEESGGIKGNTDCCTGRSDETDSIQISRR